MEVRRGQRFGTSRFTFEGYNFHRDSRYNGWVIRYLCASRNTEERSQVKVWQYGNNQPFRRGRHYHIRPIINERAEVINHLRQRAMANNELPNNIVNAVFRDLPIARALKMRPEAGRLQK